MQDIKNLITIMKAKIVAFSLLGALVLILLALNHELYVLLGVVVVALYGYFSVKQIDIKIEKGDYQFVYAKCVDAAESRAIVNSLPSSVRGLTTNNKSKSYDFTFEAPSEDGETTIAWVISAGRDGRNFSPGMVYLFCFDFSRTSELSEYNMIAHIEASASGNVASVEIQEIEETQEEELEPIKAKTVIFPTGNKK